MCHLPPNGVVESSSRHKDWREVISTLGNGGMWWAGKAECIQEEVYISQPLLLERKKD
jgi:hypothetical protein